jgi:hypothetical protein
VPTRASRKAVFRCEDSARTPTSQEESCRALDERANLGRLELAIDMSGYSSIGCTGIDLGTPVPADGGFIAALAPWGSPAHPDASNCR